MKQLKIIVEKWLKESEHASISQHQGVGFTHCNEEARLKASAYKSVLQQINLRLKKE